MPEGNDPRVLRARSEVEVERVERLLREGSSEGLLEVFTQEELRDAEGDPDRASKLATALAAREACLKLFPLEASRGELKLADFASAKVHAGGQLELSAEAKLPRNVERAMDHSRWRLVRISLGWKGETAFAEARAEPRAARPGLLGKIIYYLLPVRRRVVLSNLRKVFGSRIPEAEVVRIAQAFYAHFARLLAECLYVPWLSARRRSTLVRVENSETVIAAAEKGKGVLILTGHFGSWEVAPVLGLANFPEYKGRIHFLRRPIRARWIESFVTRRFSRGGIGVIGKTGSLPLILDRLQAGDAVVFIMDQHAARKDGVEAKFFGEPASTFKSLAVIALATGAPVVPAHSWREEDGSHVLHFESPLPLLEREKADDAILANTQAYNEELERLVLRHPEQWFWLHRRWKRPR